MVSVGGSTIGSVTTTLADLKLYVKDYLGDLSDGKSDRVVLGLLNAALSELHGAHRWSRFRARGTVDMDLGVDGTDLLVLTLDSPEITLSGAEVFLGKYVSEGWDLKIESDEALYRITELRNSQTALMDKRWILAGDTRDYAWRRSTYPLPDGCQQVRGLQLSSSKNYLQVLSSDAFDREKADTPGDAGTPRVYTVREGNVEVWPALSASSTRERLVISYDRQPRLFVEHDQNTTPVDWDERWLDLLKLAIDVEIASRHTGQTSIALPVANARYQRRLQIVKAKDEQRVRQSRQFQLGGQSDYVDEAYRFRRGEQGADA